MEPTNTDQSVWTLTNKILAWAGAAIATLITIVGVLLVMGFTAQDRKITDGNATLLAQIAKVEGNQKETSANLFNMAKDISRIDANQQERMNRERDERYRKNKP